MNHFKTFRQLTLSACLLPLLCSFATAAMLTDFNSWTLVEDPAHANFSSTVDSATQITLSASGAVPNATDIGYQSIDGATATTSSSGYAFDPSANFTVAIDYDLSFGASPAGGLAIGFGIGEDTDGMNSAGAVISSNNGGAVAAGAAARINDATQTPAVLGLFPSATGSFFATYEAATGHVTVGIGTTGAAAPSNASTFNNIQQSWNGIPLLTSFFLRSDDTLGSAWTAGTADAVFSNLRVLDGSPIAVPEPTSLALLMLGSFGICLASHRRRAKS